MLDSGVRTLVTAVKHANGRDWWVVLPEDGSNRMLKILLTDKGPIVEAPQAIGHAWNPKENASQAAFSPDGTRYVRFNGWKGLDIFDFDRGAGQFYNPIESGPFSDPVIVGGGVAISPDSRCLYVTNIWNLFQYDLLAEDILGSRILIDTFDGFLGPFPTTFFQMGLAPDEKIYMFSSNSKRSLHVINKPNAIGKACEFEQHSVSLPANIFFGANNIPYFRLGPDDGSVCDTLGLNNVPVAYFRYEVNGENDHVFSLTNLSYFNPEEFHWDFGDGQTSSVEDPDAIQYLDDGIYTICLQVSNAYGSDEYCQTITVGDGVVGTDQIEPGLATVYPNPFTNTLIIQRSEDAQENQFDLFDLLGRNAGHFTLTQGTQELSLHGLPAGLYMYTISDKTHLAVQSGRVVKVE